MIITITIMIIMIVIPITMATDVMNEEIVALIFENRTCWDVIGEAQPGDGILQRGEGTPQATHVLRCVDPRVEGTMKLFESKSLKEHD